MLPNNGCFFFSFEIGTRIMQAGLKLIIWPRKTLNFGSPCLYLLSAGVTGMHDHTGYVVLGIQMRVLCVLSKHFNNWATSSAQFLLLNVLFLYTDKLMYWMLNPLLSEVGVPCCFLSVWCLPEVIYLVFFWKMLWIGCCWPHKRLQGHVQCPLESSRGSPISC